MIVNREVLSSLRDLAQVQGKKVVFTNGCFDILHAGHVTYLSEAKKLGDILIIGLNNDDSVRRLKGASRPVNEQQDRACVLDALASVDYVCIFEEDTPKELIEKIIPDVLVKGGDYRIEDIVGADIVSKNGGEIVVLPFVKGKSTTSIIERAAKG